MPRRKRSGARRLTALVQQCAMVDRLSGPGPGELTTSGALRVAHDAGSGCGMGAVSKALLCQGDAKGQGAHEGRPSTADRLRRKLAARKAAAVTVASAEPTATDGQ